MGMEEGTQYPAPRTPEPKKTATNPCHNIRKPFPHVRFSKLRFKKQSCLKYLYKELDLFTGSDSIFCTMNTQDPSSPLQVSEAYRGIRSQHPLREQDYKS